MSKKVYDADEILKMAVGLIEPDIQNADYNGDGKITAADARTNKRIDSGLSIDTPVVGNSGITNTGTTNSQNKNIYAVSNAYQNQADAILKKIQEMPDFKYDFNEDAVFKTLQEQYIKDGRLAAENVAGQAAALSGGYGNSYGATAAGQAYMGAIDNLYDKVPELEAAAYGRYQDKMNKALQNWEIIQNRADKERGYAENERAYQDGKDAYLWELALLKAELGDYSALKNMGVDTSGHEYDTAFNKALSMAQVGDYSGLKALGVDVSTAQKQKDLDFALAAASYGDYSFLKALGINTSALESPKVVYSSGSGGGNPTGAPKTDDDINSFASAADARNALRQSQGLDSSYVLDELDKEIARWQAIIDNPLTTENTRAMARYKLEQLKERYYG